MKKINWKKLFFYLAVTLGTGGLAAFLTMDSMQMYSSVNKPPLSPPSVLFPIVWSILYTLMAVSAYIVSESGCKNKNSSLVLYYVQLIVNFLWPIVFFNLEAFLFAFIWLILLVILVLYMIISFYRCKPISAYLQIPYLIWLIFAAYLNFGVYLLN